MCVWSWVGLGAGTSVSKNKGNILQLAGLAFGHIGEGGGGGYGGCGGAPCNRLGGGVWLVTLQPGCAMLASLGSSGCATLSPLLNFVGWGCAKLEIWSDATICSVLLGWAFGTLSSSWLELWVVSGCATLSVMKLDHCFLLVEACSELV